MNKTRRRLLTGLLCIALIFADVMPAGLVAQAAEISQQTSVELERGNMSTPEEEPTPAGDNSDEEDKELESSEDQKDEENGESESFEDQKDTEEGEPESSEDQKDEGTEEQDPSENQKDEGNGEPEPSEDQKDTENEEPDSSEDQEDTENEETGEEEAETPEEENPEEETEAPAISLPEDDESVETSESEIAAVLAGDEEIIAQGEYQDEDGSDTKWWIDKNGKLTVTGTGEVKRSDARAPWDKYYADITTAVIDVKGMKNAHDLFFELIYLESLDVSGFDTGQITDMSRMFYGCHRLKDLDVSGFDTGSVTNMRLMFYDCHNLTSLDVSGFDTGSVTDMSGMFWWCSRLTTLDLSSFDTGSVTDMNSMFYMCGNLTTLDLSSFDTGSVTDMRNMFAGCSWLTSLDLDNFDMSSVTDMSSMFDGCNSLRALDLSNINAPSLTTVRHMFTDCESLQTLNLSGFNAPSLTDMSEMFFNCGVRTIDLSGLNAPSVTDMSGMFSRCNSLTTLDLSGFDSSSVTNMNSMFYDCSSLTNLDLSGLDTGSVTNMRYMFYGCSSLTNLDVSGLDTGSVTDMSYMFSGCSSLTALDISGFETDSVTSMSGMFSGCSGLTNLDVSGLDTGSVTDVSHMFSGCSNLTDLNLSGFDTGSVEDIGGMFSGCSSLTDLDVSGLDTGSVTDMWSVFYNCSGLTKLDLRNWNTGKVIYAEDMFSGCSSLEVIYAPLSLKTSVSFPKNTSWSYCRNAQKLTVTELPKGLTNSVLLIKDGIKAFNYGGIYTSDGSDTEWILDWDGKLTVTGTGEVRDIGELVPWTSFVFRGDVKTAVIEVTGMTDASRLFQNCDNLESVDLSSFDTGSVKDMRRMFYNCSSLKTLDVSRFKTGLVTNMSEMFSGCGRLATLDVSSFDTGLVTDMSGMFSECGNLTTLDVSRFETGSVTDMSGMFSECVSLKTLDVSGFDTHSVTDMNSMFYRCWSLTSLDVSGFDTGLVTDMNSMFSYCLYLRGLDVSGFDTGLVTDMDTMFELCSGLTELDLRYFDMSNVTEAKNMLRYCADLEAIYAPLKLRISVDLPKYDYGSYGDWYRGGEKLTTYELPLNLSASVLLTRDRKAEAGSIAARKRKTDYLCGETVEIGDLVVTYRKSDGSIIELAANEYQILNLNDINKDTNTPGKKKLEVTYTAPDGAELSTTVELTFCIGLTGGTEGNTTIILPDKNPVYNGSRQQPEPTVTAMIDGTPELLSAGTDYTVTYANNINAGKDAVITIEGTGDYSGMVKTTFTIDRAELIIQAADVTIAVGDEMPADQEFLHEAIGLVVGDEEQLKVTVSFTRQGSEEPAVGREGVNTKEEGIYSVTLRADAGSNYEVTGYRAGRLVIAAERVAYTVTFDLMGHGTNIEIPGILAGRLLDIDELEKKSSITIPKETDSEPMTDGNKQYIFTGWYKDKTFAAKMKWDFDTDTVQADTTLYACWVEKASIAEDGSGLQMSIQDIRNQYYTGSAIKPTVNVYAADGVTLLKSGKDYTITYKNNINAVPVDENGEPVDKGGMASFTNFNKAGETKTGDIGEGTFNRELPYVIITGKGNYQNTICKNFQILPADISADDGSGSKMPAAGFTLKYSDQLVTSTKKAQNPFSSLKYKKAMKLGQDFMITLKAEEDVQYDVNVGEDKGWSENGNSATTKSADGKKYTAPTIPKGYYGTFTMTVTGKGNYTGSFTKTVMVTDKDHLMKNAKITLGKNQKSVSYTDYADRGAVTLTPGYWGPYAYHESGDTVDLYNANDIFLVTVKDGKATKYLRADEGDFTVSYANNKAVGTATMTVTGNPERGYYGSKSVTFKITGAAFNTRNVTIVEERNASSRETGFKASISYTGRAITQNNVTLKPNTAGTLIYGKHYTISYKNNIKKGTATMTFTARPESGYTGSIKKTFKIAAVDLSESAPVDLAESAPITIEGVKDGGHKFDNVEGIEGYGWGEENDTATYYSLGGTVAYTREGAKPSAHIRIRRADWEGNAPDAWIILKEGTDYTVQYANNAKVAKSSKDTPNSSPIMIIKGKGNYAGTMKVIFNISEAAMEGNGNITVSVAAMAYNANKANDYVYQPKVTVKDGSKTLSAKNDYAVEYKNCTQKEVREYLDELAQLGNPGSGKTWDDIKEKRPYAVITAKEGSGYTTTEGITADLTIYETKLTNSNLYVVVSEENLQTTYTGAQVTPEVTVYYGDAAAVKAAKKDTVTDGAALTKQDGPYRLTKLAPKTETGGDGDYTVTYGVNNTAGKNKGSVTITGASMKYGGSVTVKFEIKKRDVYHVLYNTP